MDTPVRIGLMTTIGVTERLSTWNQHTEVHDWKRRAERLVRASGHPYTIVRPGWFDYNNDDEHRIVMLQGDRRHAGTPEDGVISRKQIAQVLVSALSNDAATNKTFELVAERGATGCCVMQLRSVKSESSFTYLRVARPSGNT
jgi:uncharacterized protein YbjT (DUF2867 family)